MEHCVYILTTFCTGLKKLKTMLVGQSLSSSRVYDLRIVRHVHFISYQNFFDVWYSVLINLFEPVGYIIESSFVSDIVDQQNTHGSFVVSLSDRSKSLLPRCIPNLKFHAFIRYVYCFYPEIYSDCWHMSCGELIV